MFRIFSCCQSRLNSFNENLQNEKDFKVKKYQGKDDAIICELEKQSMHLYSIKFHNFISQLIDFNTQNATVNYDSRKDIFIHSNNNTYNEVFNEDTFHSFIENKIVKIEPLYTKFGDNELLGAIFKDILIYTHYGLIVRLKKFLKEGSKADKTFRKSHAIALAMVYCDGRNDEKLRYLFELFKEGDVLKERNQDLNDFLGAMFFLASYCMIYSRKKLSEKYEAKYPNLSNEEVLKIIDAYEVIDIERLVMIFNGRLFSQPAFTYEELRKYFEVNDLGWIFHAKVIRYQLEANNDIKE